MEQRKWYLFSEVEKHNKYDDCWIILNGKVLDMSNYLNDSHITCNKHSVNSVNKYCPCCSSHKNIKFIGEYAGKDISEWFRHNGKTIKSFVHPLTYTLCSYTPSIKIQDKKEQPKSVPLWRPIRSIPWWEDAKLVIGNVTSKPRFIRLSNALTKTYKKIEVCEEETLDEILRFRCHPWSKEFMDYAWGYDGRKLHVDKTLSENGVVWEETKRDRFEEVPEIVPHLTLYPNEEVTDGDLQEEHGKVNSFRWCGFRLFMVRNTSNLAVTDQIRSRSFPMTPENDIKLQHGADEFEPETSTVKYGIHYPSVVPRIIPRNKYVKKIWYLPGEVVIHNEPTDCWVSLQGRILDLTPLIAELTTEETDKGKDEQHKMTVYSQGAKIILALAGKDVSHWFKKDECQLKTYVHPIISASFPYSPHGLRPHQSVLAPSTAWRPVPDPPWWEDTKYDVGRVTKNVRPIKITNTLISNTVQINVCEEETIYEIMEFRYCPWYNRHCSSYTWCYMGKKLCLNQTLTKNGIIDERDRFEKFNLPEDTCVPNIQLYFNDDFTITCPHRVTGPCPKNCECFNPEPVAHSILPLKDVYI